jgi:hypothetical protein
VAIADNSRLRDDSPERRWLMNRFERLVEQLLSGGVLTKWN